MTAPTTADQSTAVTAAELRGVRRYLTLWRLFRRERDDPDPFYSTLADLAVADLDERHGVQGRRILDLGAGAGWYTEALRRAGADVVSLELDRDEMSARGMIVGGAVCADAGHIPAATSSFDGVFCSNLLEHAPDTAAIIDEIARVLRPGGWGYVSWTNWYSPWGGHEMTPYHYLGPERGPRLYERRHGPPRKNRFGEGLFAVHVGPTVGLVRAHRDLQIERVEPRYWPWARAVTRVPGLRELVTWNCLIRLRAR